MYGQFRFSIWETAFVEAVCQPLAQREETAAPETLHLGNAAISNHRLQPRRGSCHGVACI